MRKIRGPRIDTCATLAKTGLHDDICPFKTTFCGLPDSKFSRRL